MMGCASLQHHARELLGHARLPSWASGAPLLNDHHSIAQHAEAKHAHFAVASAHILSLEVDSVKDLTGILEVRSMEGLGITASLVPFLAIREARSAWPHA